MTVLKSVRSRKFLAALSALAAVAAMLFGANVASGDEVWYRPISGAVHLRRVLHRWVKHRGRTRGEQTQDGHRVGNNGRTTVKVDGCVAGVLRGRKHPSLPAVVAVGLRA